MTPMQLGNGRDVESLFVALNHDIKATGHTRSSHTASSADVLATGSRLLATFLALRRLFFLELLPLLLQNRLPAQLDFIAFERQNLYQNLIALIQLIAHLLDAAF